MDTSIGNKRIDHLDTCKGILIILVIIGHAIEIVDFNYTGYFFKLIYSFHMPAFFIISGFFTNISKWKSKGFKAFLVSRIQKYLIPYFIFEYLQGAIVVFLLSHNEIQDVIPEVILILVRSFTIYVNYIPSWFLITLFFSTLLIYLLDNKNIKVIVCEIVILICVTIIGKYLLQIWYDLSIKDLILFTIRITISSVFMLIGLLWRRIDLSKINSPIIKVGCLALTISIPFFTDWWSISSFTITFVTLFVITGISGTYLVVSLSKLINCKALQFIGRESLLIFGTHQLIRNILQFRFTDIYYSKYAIPVYLVGVVLLEAIAIPLLNKCVPFLSGKKTLSLPRANDPAKSSI